MQNLVTSERWEFVYLVVFKSRPHLVLPQIEVNHEDEKQHTKERLYIRNRSQSFQQFIQQVIWLSGNGILVFQQ